MDESTKSNYFVFSDTQDGRIVYNYKYNWDWSDECSEDQNEDYELIEILEDLHAST